MLHYHDLVRQLFGPKNFGVKRIIRNDLDSQKQTRGKRQHHNAMQSSAYH